MIKLFLDQILFEPNILGPTHFLGHKKKNLTQNFFRSQHFVEPKFGWPRIVLDPNFLGLNFFLDLNCLDSKFLDQNFVWTKYFSYRPEIILLNFNIDETTTSLDPNLSGPKVLPKFVLIRNLRAIILNYGSILSQIFGAQISLYSEFLRTQKIFGAEAFWTKYFFEPDIFGTKFFFDMSLFYPNFFKPNFSS